ncbi:LTA synthase family protein [Aliamphritea hakodatensis]|uniref:LTA synthase family protein n=1 Tax=Aliamphritea hakodatensis TaxID=2895352 RepID=UPI0022FD6764|nr:LTA synthase family protein [Aliamphritea hakodatensis]
MYQLRYRELSRTIFETVLAAVIILLLARLAMFIAFVDTDKLAGKEADLIKLFTTGLLFDLKASTIFMVPVYLAGLAFAAFGKFWKGFSAFARGYSLLVIFGFTLISISNYYYYETYHNHFDIFIFGLAEDDTAAVLANIWQDYPVIRALLAAIIATFLLRLLSAKKPVTTVWSKTTAISYGLIFFSLFAVASRGSVDTFPLRRSNAQISDLNILNKLTPNGLIAISWANKDKRKDAKFDAVEIADVEQLNMKLFGNKALQQTSAINPYLEAQPPHVILALMESMGSNILELDNPQNNDLLGSLRPHFESDFLYKRFVSAGNGTAPSLAAILFNSPVPSISHSSAQKTPLAGSIFRPYKKAGYKTVFISPGNMMWRNLVNYLPLQGVDKVYDQNFLMKEYPQAKGQLTAWGVPDEYAFKLAKKLLDESEQPLFINILTVSNHPPYFTPDTYTAGPVEVSAEYQARAGGGEIELDNILNTFQYAADSLGRFIGAVKASDKLADHTVIAATGDHQMRRFEAKLPEESMLDSAVPFYLRVPDSILNSREFLYDNRRIGSHKDIMPTLYNLSLSGRQYFTIGGRDLLMTRDDPQRNFGYNESIWINSAGTVNLYDTSKLYPWHNDTLMLDAAVSNSHLSQQKISMFIDLQRTFINWEVTQANALLSTPVKQ